MRVWTDGKTVLGWLPVGKLRIDLEDASNSVFETEPDPDRKQADAEHPSELFAPTPKKGKDLLETYGGPEPVDVVAVSAKEVAAVVVDDAPTLWMGAPKAKKPQTLSLDADGTAVEWPERTMWAAATPPPVSKDTTFGVAGARSVRLHHGPHGLAIAAGTSGHVAVMRPKSKELDFVLRLPCHEHTALSAIATEAGALITMLVEDRHALVVHVEPDGTILGRWPDTSFAWGVKGMGLLGGGHAVVYEGQSQSVSMLRLPDLAEIQRHPVGVDVVDVATSPDGATFALGSPNQIVVGKLDAENERFSLATPHTVAALVAYAQNEETTRVSRYRPETAGGPTTVGFSALDSSGIPWTAKAGEPFELVLTFRSAGSAGQGVVLELGGAAIDEGFVEVDRVTSADDDDVELVDGKAELPNVRIVQGLTYPLDPKPKKPEDKEVGKIALEATHFELRLHGKAHKAGRPLFWIAVGALEGTAPVKRTRPFIIE